MEGKGKNLVGTTAIEIAFSGVTESITVSADIDNSGLLFIGKSNVTNTGANAIVFLQAGESVEIDYDDTINAVYVVSDTAAQNYWAGTLK